MTENRPKPLFMVGSKRSGSTLLVNLFNEHPEVFVTHESDIVWILFQLFSGYEGSFEPYGFDDAKGMLATLEAYEPILEPMEGMLGNRERVASAFYSVLAQIREHGRGGWDKPSPGGTVSWIGDKKPVQQCDPEMRGFMRDSFPGATYVHLIRHPKAVVGSMMKAAREWPEDAIPRYWRGSASEILAKWAMHERWVLDLKAEIPNDVHTIRLEDLAANPVATTEAAFGHLQLRPPEGILNWIGKWIFGNPNKSYSSFQLPASAEAERIMEIYGYSTDGTVA